MGGRYRFGDFELDLDRQLLLHRHRLVDIAPKPLKTLIALIAEPGRVVSREELMSAVWPDTAVEDNNLDQQISTLRTLLGDRSAIQNIKRRGYRFTLPVEVVLEVPPEVPGPDAAADAASSGTRGVTPRAWLQRSHRVIAVAVVLTAVAITIAAWWWYGRPRTFNVPAEETGVYDRSFGGDISPDGHYLAFVARSVSRDQYGIFVRSVADGTTRLLPGTTGNYTSLFWGPDSRTVFFVSAVELMKINIHGGAPDPVARVGEGLKGTVNQHGVVVLGSRFGLLKVENGRATQLTRVTTSEARHANPVFLPDGDRILFVVTRTKPVITRLLAVFTMSTGAMRILRVTPSRVQYANGQLLYVRGRTLYARPFNADTLEPYGQEASLAAPVWHDDLFGDAGFSATTNSVLVVPPPRIPPVRHISLSGRVITTIPNLRNTEAIAMSRRGHQLAIVGSEEDGELGLTIYPRDARERVRLVGGNISSPVFSHDDARVYYAAPRTTTANIHSVPISPVRSAPDVFPLPGDWIAAPRDISPDGRFLVFQRWENRDGDIWYAPLADARSARPLIATMDEEGETARFSPNGRQLAFVAKRGGRYSVYIAEFPPTGKFAHHAITTDGWRARWRADGKALYFARERAVVEADLVNGRTRELFWLQEPIWLLEPAPDGFFVREAPTPQMRKVVHRWWPSLRNDPLDLTQSDR